MHLVWHIFKKDARLMRGPLVAWVGMQVATFIIAGLMVFPMTADSRQGLTGWDSGPAWMDWVAGGHILFLTITWMSAYFFAAIPLHEDAVSSPEALWRTRPIARWELLGAKLLGLFVFFILLPVLLRLPWWLAHGFSRREMALAAFETGQASGAIVGLALALACLTTSAGQFYRWTLVVVGGVAATVFLLLTTLMDHRASPPLFAYGPHWAGTGMMIAVPLTLVAIGQFLAPNRLRSGLLVAVFLFAGTFLVTTIPVAPNLPRLKPEISAEFTKVVFPGGKVRVTPSSASPRTLITLQKGQLFFGATAEHEATVYPESDFDVLGTAAKSFAQTSQLPPATGTYDFYMPPRSDVFEIDEAALRAEGTLWEVEYRLSIPVVAGTEIKEGSRVLRISGLLPGHADAATPPAMRGQLVLQETLPFLEVELESRPEGFSAFYFLVTPTGVKRIMPDSVAFFTSSEVQLRTAFFPFSAEETGPLSNSGAAPESMQLVKVGLRRLGTFQTQVPVKLPASKP